MTATAWADQMAESGQNYRKKPIDNYGRIRVLAAFHYQNRTGGTLPDGTEIDLGWLPPGQMRILTKASWFRTVVNGGAARVLNIGFRAYQSKYTPNPTAAEVEALAALVAAKDISTALAAFNPDAANDLFVDLYAMAGIKLAASVTGGTIPANWELEGYIAGVVD